MFNRWKGEIEPNLEEFLHIYKNPKENVESVVKNMCRMKAPKI